MKKAATHAPGHKATAPKPAAKIVAKKASASAIRKSLGIKATEVKVGIAAARHATAARAKKAPARVSVATTKPRALTASFS